MPQTSQTQARDSLLDDKTVKLSLISGTVISESAAGLAVGLFGLRCVGSVKMNRLGKKKLARLLFVCLDFSNLKICQLNVF